MPTSNRRPRHRLRLLLLRWHRRIGVVIALAVIVLVMTGIPLNHTSSLHLDRVALRAPWLLSVYGIETSQARVFPVAERWLIQAGSYLFLDDVEITRCDGELVGAVSAAVLMIAVCERELVTLTHEGDLVEKLGSAYGLPEPLTGIAQQGEQIWLRSGDRWFMLDVELLTWAQGEPDRTLQQVRGVSAIPDRLRLALHDRLIGEQVTLERVLLDIHSGRILGAVGVWLMDLVGVLLLLIALSGCYVWLSKPGRFRRSKRRR